MAIFNRRTGIAGITTAALACLICGVPFIAALFGIGGVSLGAMLSDLPTPLKIAIPVVGLFILALLISFMATRHSKPTTE